MAKKTKYVPAGEFKAKCLKLMDEVKASKNPIVVTKHGKPVVVLTPYEEENYFPIGCLKHTMKITGDIVGPTGVLWEAEQDG